MRIKIIKDGTLYKAGQTVEVSKNAGHRLISAGIGILTKDLIDTDFKTKTLENAQETA